VHLKRTDSAYLLSKLTEAESCISIQRGQFLIGAGSRLEPVKTDPAVWMGARRELSLRRNKGQSANTVMKWMGLHLRTPNDHYQEALRKCSWEKSMEITSWN